MGTDFVDDIRPEQPYMSANIHNIFKIAKENPNCVDTVDALKNWHDIILESVNFIYNERGITLHEQPPRLRYL